MEDAKLTPRKLATRIGVAPKTVERWLADAELLPHARNRADACRALKVDEDMIWPKAVQERVKTGHDRELAHAYPYRSACPSTVWGELIAGASTDILFAGTRTTSSGWSNQRLSIRCAARSHQGAGCASCWAILTER
ncbi:hypothetical protein [Streptomyces anulatus]|uniref:hypothetical protein n=1 Tax=Streptomyces anulatus TaxID=1892 RepID=UPI0027E286AE|nr:hypothetical protein [Streptomyces anulatus]